MPVITKKVGQSIMIEADDLVAFDPNGGLELWANSISGSFTEPRGVAPCSILINRGVDICSYSCHAWLGYPEAVIYRYKDGTFGCGKFMYTKQIPNRGDVLWAVGGMGLLSMYAPSQEGFGKGTSGTGVKFDYTDVLRDTSHTMLGVKEGKVYLVYIPKATAKGVDDFAKSCKFEMAIMLDGGGISAINGSMTDTKVNTKTRQGYALQGINNSFLKTLPRKPLVALDAGHNELNRSNRSPDGTYIEADFNIEVTKKVIGHLNRCGVDTRFIDFLSANQNIELKELAELADESGADVLVSIHTDASSSPTANGQTIFSYKLMGEGQKLAKAIHEATVPESGMYDRGIKDGSHLYIIRVPVLPCVLIECGFHTNDEDLKKLKSPEWKEKEAILIAKGIVNYFGKKWIEPAVRTCPTCGRPL